jgi:hypothetical protein
MISLQDILKTQIRETFKMIQYEYRCINILYNGDDELYMEDLTDYNSIVSQLKKLLVKSRSTIAHEINSAHLRPVEKLCILLLNMNKKALKAESGKKLLPELSKQLTRELGLGFSHSNLKICGIFIWNTQFARRCLANYSGPIHFQGKESL